MPGSYGVRGWLKAGGGRSNLRECSGGGRSLLTKSQGCFSMSLGLDIRILVTLQR